MYKFRFAGVACNRQRSGPVCWRFGGHFRSCSGLGGRGCLDFPVTTFFDARPEVPLLSALLDNERRVAFWAWLVDRLVRRGEIAIRIAAATVKDSARAAAPRDS